MSDKAHHKQSNYTNDNFAFGTPSKFVQKGEVGFEYDQVTLSFTVWHNRTSPQINVLPTCYVGKLNTLNVEKKCNSELFIRIKTFLNHLSVNGYKPTYLRVDLFCTANINEKTLQNTLIELYPNLFIHASKAGDDTNYKINHLYILTPRLKEEDTFKKLIIPMTTNSPDVIISKFFIGFLEDFKKKRLYINDRRVRSREFLIIPAEDFRVTLFRDKFKTLLANFQKDKDEDAFLNIVVDLFVDQIKK